MAWLVNLIVGLGRLLWLAIPIIAGFIVFGLVYNWTAAAMPNAMHGNLAPLMIAGFVGAGVGTFLAGIFWR